MTAPVVDSAPMRINIRFIPKICDNLPDVNMGRIAPPSTPIRSLDSISLILKANERSSRNDGSLSSTFRKNSEENNLPIDKRQNPSVNSSAERRYSEIPDALQPPSCSFVASTRSKRSNTQNQKYTKRKRTVITPFSERCDEANKMSCRHVMPLQTTGGYFRGRPPITSFTRLGCFRIQTTAKTRLEAPPTFQSARCYTADDPRPHKTKERRHRPATHMPDISDPYYRKVIRAISFENENGDEGAKVLTTKENGGSEHNLRKDSALPPVDGKLKSTIRKLEMKQRRVMPVVRNRPGTRDVISKMILANLSKSHKPKPNLDFKTCNSFDCRKVSVSNISPFRRNLKINLS